MLEVIDAGIVADTKTGWVDCGVCVGASQHKLVASIFHTILHGFYMQEKMLCIINDIR